MVEEDSGNFFVIAGLLLLLFGRSLVGIGEVLAQQIVFFVVQVLLCPKLRQSSSWLAFPSLAAEFLWGEVQIF